jgi:hypothetical protein
MKKILSLVIALACISTVRAQYVGDAIKYSQNFPTLSARSMSMGGAFSSLGGDFSSTYINPAGLGLYRKSEFVFSPGLSLSNTSAEYLGETNDDFKYQLSLSNFGYVGTYNSNKDRGLVSASYAIGYNRLNNFNNYSYIRGVNSQTSLVDNFMMDIDGTDPEVLDAFTSRLAFDAYLIDTIPGSDFEYDTPVLLPVDQRRTVETTGGTGHWNFSFGLNFSNVWYVGMGLGVNQLSYEQEMVHSEFDNADEDTDFDNFQYTEKLDVEGNGFNVSLGTMVRLFKIMRIGASVHLPTYYRFEEAYLNSIYSEYKSGFIPSEDNGDIYAEGSFKYKLVTPLRLEGGASVQIGKAGIIAADLEYIDYSGMRLKERDSFTDFSEDNRDIQDVYRPVLNLKVGGEARFDNFFVRLGGGIYPSPYSSWELNKDAGHTELTTGLGYRSNSFFFDLGFSTLFHKEKYHLYSANEYNPDPLAEPVFVSHIADLNQHKYRFVASIGFRF